MISLTLFIFSFHSVNMILLFLEAAVALVPNKFRDHPSVRSYCRRFGRKPYEAVMDVNYHPFVRKYDYPGKWGRPDILHFSLLYALESPLAKGGFLDIYFHTVEGKLFYVEKGTRLPRSYTRFVGLISQLLRGSDTPLIHPVDISVTNFIRKKMEEGYTVVLLDEGGEKRTDWIREKRLLVMVGAFSKGPFFNEYPHHVRARVWDIPLNTWNVVGEVIAWRELWLGVLVGAPSDRL